MAAIITPGKPQPAHWLARLSFEGKRYLRLFGIWRMAALLILLLSLGLYWHGHMLDKQQQLTQQAVNRLQAARAAQPGKPQIDPQSADLARQLAQFNAFLPKHEALPDQVKRLLVLAEKDGLQLAQADYKVLPVQNTTHLRYQMILPVKADYPKIVRFLQHALQELPSLCLDNLQIKRAGIEAVEVEARLQLSLFVQGKAQAEASPKLLDKGTEGGAHE